MLRTATLILMLIDHDPTTRDTVDIVEVNRYYDTDAKLIFTQLIWYEWSGERFDVVAWRIATRRPNMLPVRYRGRWRSTFLDRGTLRVVVARHRRLTWTQYDVEVRERKTLPSSKRKGLRK